MTTPQAQYDKVRKNWLAMQLRKERAYANRTGSWNGALFGAGVPGGPFRLLHSAYHMERCERIAARFALHCSRVERALASPLTQGVRALLAA